MRQRVAAAALSIAAALLIAACGGTGQTPQTPTQPSTGGTGGAPTPPPNNLPVIEPITIQGTRPKEPENFADLGETVPLAAKVHDDETPADQLEYQWSATAGTFSGTGASVTWRAPAAATTPVEVTITLKVIERYGNPGGPLIFSHDVSATADLSLHDSTGEVGGMAQQFLLDFSDSTIRDAATILRNFDPACPGTEAEWGDVASNRKHFQILRWNIERPSVTVNFGDNFCPIGHGRIQRGDACSTTPVHWESTFFDDGSSQIADGVDWIAAYYRPALKAWKLCDSQFISSGASTSQVSRFIR